VDVSHHYVRERAENATAVTFVELFFDLVYVFAVTQISHLLLGDLSWHGACCGWAPSASITSPRSSASECRSWVSPARKTG